jgi:hypothetical protein
MKLATEKTPLPPDTKAHNVVVSGGYSPFAGYGFDMDSWSFTVDTTKPFPGKSINWTDSCPSELLDFVSNAVASNIASATIEDKVFVNGVDIRENRLILDTLKAMPRINIPEEVVKVRVGQVDQYMRHFRVIVIPIWVGHMHLSIFLRFAVSGTNLFAEARYFLLPPLQSALMELDNASTYCGMHYYRRLLVASAIKSTVAWINGPLLLFHWLSSVQEHIAKAIFGDPENKLKVRSTNFNYGHSASLRESWATSHYHRYFQVLDKDMTNKISQHIVVNSIIDFLESKGVATDDIKERRTTIFNSGVIVSGGTINSNQMAVGSRATIKSRVAKVFRPKGKGE